MKAFISILIISTLACVVVGCSTNRGGTAQGYDSTYDDYQWTPRPAASPSQRPGMNPEDPRDPQFLTRPDPSLSSPPKP
jgi:hypothetical protein